MKIDTEILDEIWNRIDEEIKSKGITKKELAKRCGFERKSLFSRRSMGILNFMKICKELDVSTDYILYGNDWEEIE